MPGRFPFRSTDFSRAPHMEPSKAPDKEAAWESLTPPEQNRRNWQAIVRWLKAGKTILLHPDRVWRKIRIWQVAAFIVAVAIGVGVGVLSLTPPDYFVARSCFVISAVVLLAALVHWLVVSTKSNLERLVVCVIVGGLTVFALVQALRWVNSRATAKSDNRAQVRSDEVARLVKGLGEQITREELLKKYPSGYVVFDLDYKNGVFPYDQKLLDGFELDWKGVGFIVVTQDRYELRLPSVLKDGQLLLGNPTVSGPKRVDGLGNGYAVGDTVVAAEILAITDKGMVFVIGFKRVPGLNSSK